MSGLIFILLVAAYHVGLSAPIIYALHLAHVIHYSNHFLVKPLMAWLLYVCLACALDGRLSTWCLPVRKLMKKEEAVLLPLFNEACEKGGVKRKYQVLLDASESPGAFAVMQGWVVVISKGKLRLLDIQEVKGVFAHELTHLQSGDWVVLACLNMTEFILNVSYPKIRVCMRIAMKFPLILIGMAAMLFWFRLLVPALCLFTLVYIIPVYRRCFMFCFFYAMRKREYAADRFAQSLGYGRSMLSTLTKLKNFSPPPLAMQEITKMTHPIIHHRIISMEKNETG